VHPAARHCTPAFPQASATLIVLMASKSAPVAVHTLSHSQSRIRGEALGSAPAAGPGRTGAAREDATVHPTVVSAKIRDTQIPNLFMERPFLAIDRSR
jgi:hypothetical protein